MSPEEEGFTCEECGEARATVHRTDIVNGKSIQHHFCAECYAQKEGAASGGVAEFFNRLLQALAPELQELQTRQCPACGISYLEFRQTMQLGCPEDYNAFESAMEKLLERIHGATRHCGKVPPGVDQAAARQTQLRSLRKRQEAAIAEEDYELAAELRDRIAELEQHEARKPQ